MVGLPTPRHTSNLFSLTFILTFLSLHSTPSLVLLPGKYLQFYFTTLLCFKWLIFKHSVMYICALVFLFSSKLIAG